MMNAKILSLAVIVLMVLGSFGVVGIQTLEENNVSIDEYVPGEVIVGFHTQLDGLDPIDVTCIDSFEGHNIKEKIEVLNVAVVEVGEREEQDFINSIIGSPFVKYAELNWIVYAVHTPNDPRWDAQWGPQRIHCEEAWDSQQGSSNVIVAIVDTGVDYNHEDLEDNMWSDPNGYHGYDWVNNDNYPMDDHDHGTHCAGIAAAVMDNNIGIAGVAQVSIMAEKVLDSGGTGSSSQVASGITHAADNGADVISMSLSSDSPSPTIENACNYAYNTKGVVIVAAAGNDGKYGVDWPARFNSVIAVGATDNTDHRCSFSNYGEGLELVAPGKLILSTMIGDDYGLSSGTSMATPHVAGVAALAISEYPNKDNVWIRQKLVDTAEDLGPAGWDDDFGYGLVDASLGGGGPGQWPKVNIEIHKVEGLDALDFGSDPEWYYKVSVDSQSRFEYDGYEQQFLLWWIFIWNQRNIWTPDKTYAFDAENPEVEVKVKLMEDDIGANDIADLSERPNPGGDGAGADERGRIFTINYNLISGTITGDRYEYDGTWFYTRGDWDGSTDPEGIFDYKQDDAQLWFKITDDYNPPEPDLEVEGSLGGTVKKGTTNYYLGSFEVENIGTDPYGWMNSYLDWEIADYPDWGKNWRFEPEQGNDLPSGQYKTVKVYVDVPNQKDTFTGDIKVWNAEDHSDYSIIPITLTVSLNKKASPSYYTSYYKQLQLGFPHLFNFLTVLQHFKDNLGLSLIYFQK